MILPHIRTNEVAMQHKTPHLNPITTANKIPCSQDYVRLLEEGKKSFKFQA